MKRAYRSIYARTPLTPGLAALVRPLPIPWRIKRHLRFRGVITVRVDESHSFRMYTLGHIENDLFWRGYGRGWEATSLQIWARLARDAQTIIDIGSNVGVFSLAARAVNSRARLIAFEPLERMYERLVANVTLNGYELEAEPLAISDSVGTAALYANVRDDYRQASLEAERRSATDDVVHTVPVMPLDDYCREHSIENVDLIKLDIEGHEPAALRGAKDLISRWRPTLLIEILTEDAAAAVWQSLAPFGYEVYSIGEGRGLARADRPRARERRNRNYLFCQPGTLEGHDLTALLVP